jgi:hypothetical protein
MSETVANGYTRAWLYYQTLRNTGSGKGGTVCALERRCIYISGNKRSTSCINIALGYGTRPDGLKWFHDVDF